MATCDTITVSFRIAPRTMALLTIGHRFGVRSFPMQVEMFIDGKSFGMHTEWVYVSSGTMALPAGGARA